MIAIRIVLLLALLVSLALLAVSIRRLRRSRSRNAQQIRPKFSHPPIDLRLPEDPCDSCLRWSECNGAAKGKECPWR